MKKKYRYELKFVLSQSFAKILAHRLSLVMDLDENAFYPDGSYLVRSLYFDDLFNTSYHEKVDGVLYRRKYRIRFYNNDESFIRLECKMKDNNMTSKDQVRINRLVADRLITGNIYDLPLDKNKLFTEFLMDIRSKKLVPSVIVDYKRLAFTYPLSDVRINFDSEIKSGVCNYDLFNKDFVGMPVIDQDKVVLEVKFNEQLPESLAMIVESVPTFRSAVSKFAYCLQAK